LGWSSYFSIPNLLTLLINGDSSGIGRNSITPPGLVKRQLTYWEYLPDLRLIEGLKRASICSASSTLGERTKGGCSLQQRTARPGTQIFSSKRKFKPLLEKLGMQVPKGNGFHAFRHANATMSRFLLFSVFLFHSVYQ